MFASPQSSYFTCLGLGYLFIEIVCIQQFALFLAHPISSASVVIASFLIFSGCGSLFFAHIADKREKVFWPRHSSGVLFLLAVAGIVLCVTLYTLGLPQLFSEFIGWNYPLKVVLSILLLAPLAFCLGIPFPFGLRSLSQQADELVPWAYGINGYASVPQFVDRDLYRNVLRISNSYVSGRRVVSASRRNDKNVTYLS